MRVKRSVSIALFLLAVLGFAIRVKAAPVVFGLTATHDPTTFDAHEGIGQAVSVSEGMTIDGFAFFLAQKGGGSANYFIYDATTSSLTLAPTPVEVAMSSSAKRWTSLDFSSPLTLDAGNVYVFGVYGNDLMTIGLNPSESFFSDGLGLPATGPTSYYFTGDTQASAAGENVGLRIFSNDPPAVTPEPSSLMLLGTGILAGVGAMRRLWAR